MCENRDKQKLLIPCLLQLERSFLRDDSVTMILIILTCLLER